MPVEHPILVWLKELDDRRDEISLYTGDLSAAGIPLDGGGALGMGIRRSATGIQPVADLTVPLAREAIRRELREYMDIPNPEHMLLVRVTPGVGKTTAAVALAEELAAEGKRVLYAAPRRNFYTDIQQIAKHPQHWYQWNPRHAGDDTHTATCAYADDMASWLHRGYRATNFCLDVCGAAYMHTQCVWHAQKQRKEPIIFGQHQHVILGHPMAFDVIIGDESPIAAFLRLWRIPAKHIAPDDVNNPEIAEMLARLVQVALTAKTPLEGEALLRAIGGAFTVRRICATMAHQRDELIEPPELVSPVQAHSAPFAYLPALCRELMREADMAMHGAEYIPRVIAFGGQLHLVLRHPMNEKMPAHVIWLDATGNEHLYEASFGRPVRVVAPQVELQGKVFQVWDRSNGVGQLYDYTKDLAPTANASQLISQIARIQRVGKYKRMGIITHKRLRERIETEFPHALVGHFGGSRGTNEFEQCDGLVVAGTPMPPASEMEAFAKMIYYDRGEPFNTDWTNDEVAYAGQPWSHLLAGYWSDADMSAVLWQHREAELIQAAHRIRLSTRDADLWLLTSVPLRELPPTRLLTVRDLFGAPPRINPYVWQAVVDLATERMKASEPILTAPDVALAIDCDGKTARKYLNLLVLHYPGWEHTTITQRNGRPPMALRYVGVAVPLAATISAPSERMLVA